MPIILPEGLASAALLRREGIEVLHRPQGLSPTLRVGLLNLMPDMTSTEVQFGRLLGATPFQVELVLALPPSYRREREGTCLYERWGEASLPRRLDGLIATGAPLEHLTFEDVRYWRELLPIFNWAVNDVGSTLYVCWSAFAALYVFHGMQVRVLPHKLSGVFEQRALEAKNQLIAGLGNTFPCPVSRYSQIAVRDIPAGRGLTCIAGSRESGLCLVADGARNAHYLFNHLEYNADTLKLEYLRDRLKLPNTAFPSNYLPNDDLSQLPRPVWRRTAERLFANWLGALAARSEARRSRFDQSERTAAQA